MNSDSIEGREIPYVLDFIEKIDPDIVGHATLFTRKGDSMVVGEIQGRIRELLIADYKRRSPNAFPELVMYSGSRVKEP
jgi:hypothetical protein